MDNDAPRGVDATENPARARVDEAHAATVERHVPGGPTVARGVVLKADTPAAADAVLVAAPEQLQRHADELSGQLRARHRELSRWEAKLHARIARWEDEQRANRIWISERTAELDQRALQLDARAGQLGRRAAELEQADRTAESIQARQDELDDRAACLERLEQQLCQERQCVQQQAAWLDAARRSWAERQRCQIARDAEGPDVPSAAATRSTTPSHHAHIERIRALESLERLARHRLDSLTREQAAFAEQREAWTLRTQRQRRQLARIWQRRRQLLKTRARAIQQQQNQLAERRQTLHRLATQLGTMPAQVPTAPSVSARNVTSDSPAEPYQPLVDALIDQRRTLRQAQQSLRKWATRQQQRLERQQRELVQTRHEIEAAEIRLSEARRDWIGQWRQEEPRIQRWLEAI